MGVFNGRVYGVLELGWSCAWKGLEGLKGLEGPESGRGLYGPLVPREPLTARFSSVSSEWVQAECEFRQIADAVVVRFRAAGRFNPRRRASVVAAQLE
jgi:hypothetical protein